MDFKKRRIQYFAAFSVSLAAATVGTIGSWPSVAVPKLLSNETSIVLNEYEVTWAVVMTPPGIVAGSLAISHVADRFGRRNTILLSAFPSMIGFALIALVNNKWYIYVARLLCGFTVGVAIGVVPMYIGEIADKEIRGPLILFASRTMFSFGNLIVMLVGSFVSFELLNYLMLALPITYFTVCLWIPESPYFFLKEGKVGAAKKTMKRLSGMNDKMLQEKLEMVQTHIKHDMRRATSFKELFTGKRYRQALLIALGLKSVQMMSGFMTLNQYSPRIMQESKANMHLGTMLIVFGAIRFGASIIAAFIVDKVNRRIMYIISYFGTFVSCSIVSIYFYLQEVMQIDLKLLETFGFVPFVGLIGITLISNLGYNAVTFLTIAEIFPINVKAVAMTTIGCYDGFLNFGTTLTFQIIKQHIGMYASLGFFGLVCLCGTIFVYLYVPETKGKSLEEIQVLLQGEYFNQCVAKDVEIDRKHENNKEDVIMSLIDKK